MTSPIVLQEVRASILPLASVFTPELMFPHIAAAASSRYRHPGSKLLRRPRARVRFVFHAAFFCSAQHSRKSSKVLDSTAQHSARILLAPATPGTSLTSSAARRPRCVRHPRPGPSRSEGQRRGNADSPSLSGCSRSRPPFPRQFRGAAHAT